MPGLMDITAPYSAGIEELLNEHQTEVNEELVHTELRKDDQPNSAAAVESAFRQIFYGIVASNDIDDPTFAAMWRFLDIVNVASDTEICDAGLPFLLIEELLDSQTIHGCRKVFDYLESRRERMTAKHWKAKQLIILRSCNELLRRLSRAEDTVFCGRVFIFLFQSFPLGDKSSVNLRGEYHTDNVTQYDQVASTGGQDGDSSMAVDEERPGGDGSTTDAPPVIKIDGKETVSTDALYPTFWALQELFAQPTKLFDTSYLENFKNGLQETLKKFKEVYRDEPRSSARTNEDGHGVKRKLDDPDGDNFNPRYLTSRDLFELEIHDPAFRRHILVQALIAVDFLLSQTAKARSKLENLKNKSVIYDFVLGEKDAQWASNMRAEIASYLQQGSEGKFYYRMVDTVLARDKNWLRWKAESCPPFQLEPVGPDAYSEARTGVEATTRVPNMRKAPLGALDASFLEARGADYDPLPKYQEEERWKKPDLKGFQGQIGDAQFDLEMAQTDEEKEKAAETRSSNVWRALRSAARFSIFDKLDDGSNIDYLFKRPEEREEEEEEERREAEPEEAEKTLVQIDGAVGDKDDDDDDDDEMQDEQDRHVETIDGKIANARDAVESSGGRDQTGHEPEAKTRDEDEIGAEQEELMAADDGDEGGSSMAAAAAATTTAEG